MHIIFQKVQWFFRLSRQTYGSWGANKCVPSVTLRKPILMLPVQHRVGWGEPNAYSDDILTAGNGHWAEDFHRKLIMAYSAFPILWEMTRTPCPELWLQIPIQIDLQSLSIFWGFPILSCLLDLSSLEHILELITMCPVLAAWTHTPLWCTEGWKGSN